MFLLLFIVYTNPYAEINQFLDSWHQAAAEARELDYFAKLAEDAVFLGTDATERWSKLEFQKYAHPYFAQGKAWLFKATRRAVILSSDRNLAWFDEDLETEKMGKCRG
ncbi:MAG TPA: nuclear transport factor 2 family protein, partial [Gemmatales bacterium]|nr:nuclear transport factor 2 family protein [Gemmatales bacterium]